MAFALIPFVIFMACVLTQLILLRQVRQALALRHPEVWREISSKAWFIENAVAGFAWSGRHAELNDPDLTRKAKLVRRLFAIGFAAWLAFAVLVVAGPVLWF